MALLNWNWNLSEMETSPSSSSFTVYVKSQDEAEDLPIPNLTAHVTTKDLKEVIAQSHSRHPAASGMKLIFGGRVLPDDSTLGDVFSRVGSTHHHRPSDSPSIGRPSSFL